MQVFIVNIHFINMKLLALREQVPEFATEIHTQYSDFVLCMYGVINLISTYRLSLLFVDVISARDQPAVGMGAVTESPVKAGLTLQTMHLHDALFLPRIRCFGFLL